MSLTRSPSPRMLSSRWVSAVLAEAGKACLFSSSLRQSRSVDVPSARSPGDAVHQVGVTAQLTLDISRQMGAVIGMVKAGACLVSDRRTQTLRSPPVSDRAPKETCLRALTIRDVAVCAQQVSKNAAVIPEPPPSRSLEHPGMLPHRVRSRSRPQSRHGFAHSRASRTSDVQHIACTVEVGLRIISLWPVVEH